MLRQEMSRKFEKTLNIISFVAVLLAGISGALLKVDKTQWTGTALTLLEKN